VRPLQIVKGAAYRAAWQTGALAALRWLHRDRLPILCYHSVVEGPAPAWARYSGGLHLPVAQFRQQLEFLTRRYRVLSLETAVAVLAAGRRLPARSVVLTFDDGYANNLHVAGPLLAEYGCTATIFLATDYIGRSLFWWDDLCMRICAHAQLGNDGVVRQAALDHGQELLRAATLDERMELLHAWGPDPGRHEAVRPATWEECRTAPANIDFGGHGAAHRLLDAIPVQEARAELDDCQRALRAELGPRAAPVFCYPAGQWTDDVRASLPAAGFKAAVTASPHRQGQRLVSSHDELTLLPRIGVTSGMTLAAFAAKLAGV
jgi:peptidoglycan/xylan/chitin deacetylase (PgdA/CDA1 family)